MATKDKKAGTGFDSAPSMDKKRIDHAWGEDGVFTLKTPKKTWIPLRFLGSLTSIGQHWITITTKEGKETTFPKTCLAYDSATHSRDSTKKCPYCDMERAKKDSAKFAQTYFMNAVVRSIQEDAPAKIRITPAEKESGFKSLESQSWTAVRVVQLPSSVVSKLKALGDLNRVKGKPYQVADLAFGCDVNIQYDSKASGTDKYAVQKGERTPITEEEEAMLVYDLDVDFSEYTDTLADAKVEVKRLTKGGTSDEDDEDDTDGDYEDDEDDEEDEPPRSKKKKEPVKSTAKSKAKPEPEDDEDDDLDLEDEDEDEDDDLDLEDEDEDEDDEDEPPPPKSKMKAKVAVKVKSKAKPEPEDDEDEDEDEDDEDEPPPPKSKMKAKPAAAPAAKGKKPKSKSMVDEDDEIPF